MRNISILAIVLLAAAGAPASATELKCFFPLALKSPLNELIPRFEKSSGNTVEFEYGLIGGMMARLQNDEVADVVVLADAQIAELERQGKIVEGSRAGVAKLGLGVFVSRAAVKPDVSSVDAFKHALLSAKTIAYVDPATGAPSGVYMAEVMNRLGIAADMRTKTKLTGPMGPLFDAIGEGDADIGFTMISEIVAEPKVVFAGPLPADIQYHISYAAGLVVAGKQRTAGEALISFLTSPPARAVLDAKGFEPF
jgi:molybdate transport system substrate-binding protein